MRKTVDLINASYLDFLNLWTDAINKENYELAANLDALFHIEHIRKTESLEMWERWQRLTFDKRKKLTNYFKKEIPSISYSKPSPLKNVAIVYDQFSGLAHETQLARSIRYFKNHSSVDFKLYIIYAFGEKNTKPASVIHNVEEGNVIHLDSRAIMDVGVKLSEVSKIYGIDVIIYGSTFELAFWSSLTCNHINQKYLIMKYYPNICGRFSSFAGGRENHNKMIIKKNFEYLQLSILDLNIKTQSDYPLIHKKPKNFGSISRIQKTINPTYQELVLNLLNTNPTSNYIYAGNESEIDLIDSRILNHERCLFLGWVEPTTAINDFSLYVDPFPWGGGEMTLLALANGIPYLTLTTKENENIGIYRFLKYLLSTQLSNPYHTVLNSIFCSSIADLELKFNRLYSSYFDRVELGIHWQVALENYKPQDLSSWEEFLTY